MLVAASAVVWSLHWTTGLQPLAPGSGGTQVYGLKESPGLEAGAPVYVVSSAKPRFLATVQFHNSASVPVTVTGVDPIGREGGPLTRLHLHPGNPHDLSALPGPFRPVRIAAGGTGILTLAFGAVPGRVACGQIGGVSSVTLHFTTLGVFDGTQVIDLGDEALNIAGRCQ